MLDSESIGIIFSYQIDTGKRTKMNTIASQEIKRRGISAVDESIKKGPVHIIKNNQPKYVILSEEMFQELTLAENEAYMSRIRTSLEDVKAGRISKFKNVSALLKAIEYGKL